MEKVGKAGSQGRMVGREDRRKERWEGLEGERWVEKGGTVSGMVKEEEEEEEEKEKEEEEEEEEEEEKG
ncbi:hypothetical protein E2C01_040821 [Portunus trituberculatus]|uniref:Uncharacterized protein n=1 Tax=Portunus trituberculatus TaxID=210409 RepID=A0A5B7FNP8_PORTR|nr:hypothetical protein [Portunus trituberculatus]